MVSAAIPSIDRNSGVPAELDDCHYLLQVQLSAAGTRPPRSENPLVAARQNMSFNFKYSKSYQQNPRRPVTQVTGNPCQKALCFVALKIALIYRYIIKGRHREI